MRTAIPERFGPPLYADLHWFAIIFEMSFYFNVLIAVAGREGAGSNDLLVLTKCRAFDHTSTLFASEGHAELSAQMFYLVLDLETYFQSIASRCWLYCWTEHNNVHPIVEGISQVGVVRFSLLKNIQQQKNQEHAVFVTHL